MNALLDLAGPIRRQTGGALFFIALAMAAMILNAKSIFGDRIAWIKTREFAFSP
jgi:hypothetical protein